MSRARQSRRAESVVGHLVAIAVLSAGAWWGLTFTTLPGPVAAWLSGLVAGLSALPALNTARRRLVAAVSPVSIPKPRPRRAGGEHG
ncbi:hypothetical protein ABZ815_51055 [Nonomuraea sp. NPDC047529]|uniref:hypothetical protein n=1 Tax=Nonomuraea sp. NPDC047529 TaxID=3155623 RepID=UPI0033F9E532